MEVYQRVSFLRQQGMTLLEVLVSMLIIGIGLGMSLSMIQSSVKNSIAAENYNTVLEFSQTIIDKMRANNSVAGQYVIDKTEFNTRKTGTNTSAPYCDKNTICTSDKRIAANAQVGKDLAEWANNLSKFLPSAEATITKVVNGEYRLSVTWENIQSSDREEETGNGSSAALREEQSYEITFNM